VSIPEQPSDPPTSTVTVRGGDVSYTDVGSGPVLLAVHGGPGSVRDWRWLGPAVEPHLRFVRLDLPGFGVTDRRLCPPVDARRRAPFVVEVADALGIDRFAVMGHSLGGALALEIAAEHPDRVTGLALVASAGRRPHRPIRRVGHRVLKVYAGLLGFGPTRALLRSKMRREWESAGFPSSTPDAAKVCTFQTMAALDFARNDANARRLKASTLLAWTEDDPLIEPAIAHELADVVPDGPRLEYPEGGHNPQKTCAVELGAALVDWVGALPRGTASTP